MSLLHAKYSHLPVRPWKSHPITVSTWNPEFCHFSQIQMKTSLLGSSSSSSLIKYSSALSKHLQMRDKLSSLYLPNIPSRTKVTAIDLPAQIERKQVHRSHWSIAILKSSRAHIASEIKHLHDSDQTWEYFLVGLGSALRVILLFSWKIDHVCSWVIFSAHFLNYYTSLEI